MTTTHLILLRELREKISFSEFIEESIRRDIATLKADGGKKDLVTFMVHICNERKKDNSSDAIYNKLWATLQKSPAMGKIWSHRGFVSIGVNKKKDKFYEATVAVTM